MTELLDKSESHAVSLNILCAVQYFTTKTWKCLKNYYIFNFYYILITVNGKDIQNIPIPPISNFNDKSSHNGTQQSGFRTELWWDKLVSHSHYTQHLYSIYTQKMCLKNYHNWFCISIILLSMQ